jgi:hypothetical protein
MPDGPNPNGPDYDEDFYAWTQHQAEVLRAMPVADNRFDRDNVAEEIETLGRNERDAVRSHVRRIIEHFLKLQYSPAKKPRYGWMGSIAEARSQLLDKMTPKLRQQTEAELVKLYRDAKRVAQLGLQEYGEDDAATGLPVICPYSLDDVCRDDWYPEPEAKQP